MADDTLSRTRARRSFLSRLTLGAAAGGLIPRSASAAAAAAGQAAAFRPATHAQDDWLDKIPGRHRLAIDATLPTSVEGALLYASNFLSANATGYGVSPTDLAVVIILRHHATAFAFTDAMWAKYGTALSKLLEFTDPDTHAAPTKNIHNVSGVTLQSVAEQGVRFAVCGVAMRWLASGVAGPLQSAAIFSELSANLIAGATVVPAGIVTVGRAQERGYAYTYAG